MEIKPSFVKGDSINFKRLTICKIIKIQFISDKKG